MSHRFAWAVLGLFLSFAGLRAEAADRLPDFDIQAGVRGTTLTPPRNPAGLSAGGSGGLTVRFDALTGNASRIFRQNGTVTAPRSLSADRIARSFLAGHPEFFAQKPSDANSLYIPRRYQSRGERIQHLWLGQQFRGIPVFKSETAFHVTSRGEILSVSGSPVSNLAGTIVATTPRISPGEALLRATQFAGMPPQPLAGALNVPQGARRAVTFGRGNAFSQPPVVQLSYFPVGKARTALAWDTTLWQTSSSDVYHILVDATNGQLLFRKNYTSYASGQVYDLDSPQDGTPFTSTPSVIARVVKQFNGGDTFDGSALFANNDSHFDWWAGAATTSTIGNNTHAGSARAGVNNSITAASAGNGDFSFTLDLTQDPTNYQDAASTNLFYWNNRLHDIWYQFGFDEVAGNFQTNNFGLGGVGNDATVAHAQFNANGNSRNNANFSTPPDGSPGLMRMFVFNITNPQRDGDIDNEVIAHEYGHGVTNRLVGNGNGLTQFQGGAMGEGWSDFQELMVLMQSGDNVSGIYPVGGYVINNFPLGIRSQPYSATGVFTHTYNDIKGLNGGQPEVHDAGEIMCNALFQTYVRFVNRLGFSAGRRRIMQLFIDALKITPDEPTFLDFRNALLLADHGTNGGADAADIWAAFASRGMGVSASTSGPADTNPTNAFDVPATTYSISGHVTNNAVGVNGATVSITGQGTSLSDFSASPALAIPDNNPTGVDSTLNVSQTGTVASLSVDVNITHTFIGDLVVTLVSPDNTSVVLSNRAGGSTDNLHATFLVPGVVGHPVNGVWHLKVSDNANGDTGTLDSWTLHLTATGNITTNTTTDSNGAYSFFDRAPGNYAVVATANGMSITPDHQDVVVTNADVTGVDFTAVTGFTISGTVTVNGVGLAGVTVSATGGATTTTNAQGGYSIGGLTAGNYTVTASLAEYTFNTGNPNVSVGPNATVNFTGTQITYTVSGTVRQGTAGVSGVTVEAGGHSTSTAANGTYTITGLVKGNYTVTPSKTGFTVFDPTTRDISVGPSKTSVDFTGTSKPVVIGFTIAVQPIHGKKKNLKGTVQLNIKAPSPQNIIITSSSPVLKIVGGKATAGKNKTTAPFKFNTTAVTQSTPVTLTFKLNGLTFIGQVTVEP